jgi:uncharacterized protein (DUF2345 family)
MLSRPIKSLDETDQGIGVPEGGGAGTVPAFGRPDIVTSAPGGIALLTPNDAHTIAASITIVGGQDVSATVGANYAAAVKSGISLFTYGDAKAKRNDKGIKLHAASGKFTMQAQSAELKAAADKDLNISSTSAKVEAAASEHVLLTAGGAYVKIVGGNIQIHAPGSVQFKAGQKALSGGANMTVPSPNLPIASELYLKPVDGPHSLRFAALGADEMLALSGWAGHPFTIKNNEGDTVAQGVVPENGRLPRVTSDHAELHVLRLGDANGAQLAALSPQTIEPPTDCEKDRDEEGDAPTVEHEEDDNENTNSASAIFNNRYFQDVLNATFHHGSHFLSESDIANIISNADKTS